MNSSFAPIVTDDKPTIAQKIFPLRAIQDAVFYFTSIRRDNLKKILGEKFPQFDGLIYKIIGMAKGEKRPELSVPVIPLCYYNALLEKYPQDKEALKAHGFSHTFRALMFPEYRYLWRRMIDMIRIMLELNMKACHLEYAVKHFSEIGSTITSLFPTEEIIATYLRDSPIASRGRRTWLKYFGRRELKNNVEWPYIIAYKSIYILSGCGFDTARIEELIRLCDYQVNLHEIRGNKNGRGYLSNLPYLINIFKHIEEIKGRPVITKLEIINKILNNPAKIRSFEFSSHFPDFVEKGEIEIIKLSKALKSEEIWEMWKRISFQHYLDSNNKPLSMLYCIPDLIILSFIAIEGESYEFLFPMGIIQVNLKKEEKKLLIETLVLIKLLLLELLLELSSKLDFNKGDEIEAFGEKIIFPKIEMDYVCAKRLLRRIENEMLIEEIKDKLIEIANKSKFIKKGCKCTSLDILKKNLSPFNI